MSTFNMYHHVLVFGILCTLWDWSRDWLWKRTGVDGKFIIYSYRSSDSCFIRHSRFSTAS